MEVTAATFLADRHEATFAADGFAEAGEEDADAVAVRRAALQDRVRVLDKFNAAGIVDVADVVATEEEDVFAETVIVLLCAVAAVVLAVDDGNGVFGADALVALTLAYQILHCVNGLSRTPIASVDEFPSVIEALARRQWPRDRWDRAEEGGKVRHDAWTLNCFRAA